MERKNQHYCERLSCRIACGFTDQPALILYKDEYLCPSCIEKKRKQEKIDKLQEEE